MSWRDEIILEIRLAFGCRINHNSQCVITDFNFTGKLEKEELTFSQEEKNNAREKFVSSKESCISKDRPRDINVFFSKLHNDEVIPLYHIF